MAHFARLDQTNTVIQVHLVDNAWILDENGKESESVGISYLQELHNTSDRFVQTSYNNNFRVRYAWIGYFYDENLDAFIPPKPYESWVLNENTLEWEAPIEMPNDGNKYDWNEETTSWDLRD